MSLEAKTFLQQLGDLFRKHESHMFEYLKGFQENYNNSLSEVKGNRSANRLVPIVEGVEYREEQFFTLQCVNTNTEECVMVTESGEITFPPGSFYKGANYPINIIKIKKSGNVQFIGYIL
jgi:hypothetical protein